MAVKVRAPVGVPLKVPSVVGVGADTDCRGEREPKEVEEEVVEVDREGDELDVIPPVAETAGDFEMEGEEDAVEVPKDVHDTSGVTEVEAEVLGDRDSLSLGEAVE